MTTTNTRRVFLRAGASDQRPEVRGQGTTDPFDPVFPLVSGGAANGVLTDGDRAEPRHRLRVRRGSAQSYRLAIEALKASNPAEVADVEAYVRRLRDECARYRVAARNAHTDEEARRG